MANQQNQLLLFSIFAFSVYFFLLLDSPFSSPGVLATIPPQDKIKNFTKRYLTPFLTDDQLYNMSKTIALDMYNEKTQNGIYLDLLNSVFAQLTSAQLSSAMNYAFCLMMNGISTTTASIALDQAATGIGKRLVALYNQTLVEVQSMKTVPKGVNAVCQQVYQMGQQFESQQNICYLMAGAYRAMNTVYWNGFRKCLAPVIYYTKCGM